MSVTPGGLWPGIAWREEFKQGDVLGRISRVALRLNPVYILHNLLPGVWVTPEYDEFLFWWKLGK